MDALRVAIAGVAGLRGQQLEALFKQAKDVRILEGADPVHNRPFKSILGDDVDVVVIATPDHLHEGQACAALAAGKHIYLEKPMAITPEGCERIVGTAKKFGRVVYVGHNLRHFTVIKKLKELIDNGAVGTVKAVWCRHPVSYGKWAYYQDGRWHKKRSNSGGLLIHKGSHDLDVIHWLGGGRTKRVVAMGQLAVWHDQPGEPDVEDLSSVLMQLDNGVQATYSQCHFAFRSAREYMIHGTEGTLQNEGDHPSNAVVRLFRKRGKDLLGKQEEEWHFIDEQGFHGDADTRIVNEFLGVIRNGNTPTISIEDAVWAVKTGYAATASLRNNSMPFDVV
ncbi:MAG: Gfo/Idh/MocA family oxidoreductase [bacterium]|nr:Gfo/Idh/MocA family oxidoreductase [bacterium]